MEIIRQWGNIAFGLLKRHPLLAALVALTLSLRAVLPVVLRPVLESRVSEAINGHVEIGDLDLWLWRGAVGLQEVTVFPQTSDARPVIAWDELYVSIRWIPLFGKTLRFREIRLESPRVDINRLADGELNLLRLIPIGSPENEMASEMAETKAETGADWTVAADRLIVEAGDMTFRDFKIGSPDRVEAEIVRLEVRGAAASGGVYEGSAQLELEARIEDAALHLEGSLRHLGEGFAVRAALKANGLPLRYTRLYLPTTEWSALRGRVDLELDYELETQIRNVLRGRIELRDLAVEVPHIPRLALEWDALSVELKAVDLLARRVEFGAIELRQAAAVMQPSRSPPLPLLAGLVRSEAGGGRSKGGETETVQGGEGAPGDESTPAADNLPPWAWKISRFSADDTHVLVLDDGGATLDVAVRVSANEITPHGEAWPIEVELREGDGSLLLNGRLRIEPVGFGGVVSWKNLDIPRLVSASGLELARLVRGGKASGELKVAAGIAAPGMQASGDAVRMKGSLAVGGFSLSEEDADRFSASWESLAVDIADIDVPGVLSPGEAMAPPGPLVIHIDRVHLRQPHARLSRTGEGLILPVARSIATEDGQDSEVEPKSGARVPKTVSGEENGAPEEVKGYLPPVEIEIGTSELEEGRVTFVDQSISPTFREQISQINLKARKIRWPESHLQEISLSMTGPGKASLNMDGGAEEDGVQVQVRLENLSLPPMNAYANTYSGYGIARGTASLASKTRIKADTYTSENRLVLHELNVSAKSGENLFKDQFGVPISLALALMRDPQGDITLDLPLSGDVRGARIGLGKTVRSALQSTIVNAVASPLKLIGIVKMVGSKVEDFEIEPATCLPGRAVLDVEGEGQLQRLADLLVKHPGLVARLESSVATSDVRWFQEQELLAELSSEPGPPNEDSGAASAEINGLMRAHLEARQSGQPVEPDPSIAPFLEDLLSRRQISDQRLVELATARAEQAREILIRQGVEVERIELLDPSARVSEESPAIRLDIDAG